MNSFVLLVTISCLFCVTFAQWPGSGSRRKRNCKWTAWRTDGKCKKISNGVYRIKHTRLRIPARNGGRSCSGSSQMFVDCNEIQYVATVFMETINYRSKNQHLEIGYGEGAESTVIFSNVTGDQGVTVLKALPHEFSCTTDFRGSDKELRMVGRNSCTTSGRRRRSAEGLIELVEVPLKERKSRVKRQGPPPVLSILHRDILFLLDESVSIGSSYFKDKILRLATSLAEKFCGNISIGKDLTRVGVMSFDSTTHIHLDFDKYFQKSQVISYMQNNVGYTSGTSGSTCLVDALNTAWTDMITPARGARNGVPGTERVVILFTDGCANCEDDAQTPQLLMNAREQFEAHKIPFIVFFIGDNESCVTNMQGLADGAQCYQVFRSKTWAEFDTTIDQIESMECMDAWVVGPPCE